MISPILGRAMSARAVGRRARWLAAAGSLAVIAVAGCASSPGHPAAGGTSTGTKSPAAGLQESGAHALVLAASQAEHISSLTATVDVQPGSGGKVSLDMKLQLKPTAIIEVNSTVASAAGTTVQLDEILTSKTLYLKDAALAKQVGKPWIKFSLAALSSRAGVNFASLVQSVQNENPENQVRLFAEAKNVHVVGTQTIGGVATTEYAGSYAPAAAFARLPAALRKYMHPMLALLGSTAIPFHVWIDANHLARKAVITETISGQATQVNYLITSVNQPIHVSFPAASQTATFPPGG